jgi:hypothetical protein
MPRDTAELQLPVFPHVLVVPAVAQIDTAEDFPAT